MISAVLIALIFLSAALKACKYITRELLTGLVMLAFVNVYTSIFKAVKGRGKDATSSFLDDEYDPKPATRRLAVPRVPGAAKVGVGLRTGRL